jgi:hypothetical protein
LAGHLALSVNLEVRLSLAGIQSWSSSKSLPKVVNPEQIDSWQKQLRYNREKKFALAWESCFLIDILLGRNNYTNAFIQFAQTLERLLYIQFEFGNWLEKRYVISPAHLSYLGKKYDPTFKELIDGWCKLKKFDEYNQWYKLFDKIRENVMRLFTKLNLSLTNKL